MCELLARRVGCANLWAGPGGAPSHAAFTDALECVPAERRPVLSLAWALWTARGGPSLLALLRLPAAELALVAGLLKALAGGGEAIDAWIGERLPPRGDPLAVVPL